MCDVFALCVASERNLFQHLLFHLFGKIFCHGGFDEARRDAIDGDRARSEFQSEAFHHSDQSRFGGDIVRLSFVAGKADDRSDHDDSTPSLFQHGTKQLLRQVEDARQIDFEHIAPRLCFHVERESVLGVSCVVDENIDGLELVEDGLGELCSFFTHREIAWVGARLVADLFLQAVELGGVASCQQDLRTVLGEQTRDSRADTAAGARHKGSLGGEGGHRRILAEKTSFGNRLFFVLELLLDSLLRI